MCTQHNNRMTELFLHHIWQYQLFDHTHLKTTNGEAIEIVTAGMYNSNAGPDFLQATIKIDNTLWVGNIEIHLQSNDWYTHKHHLQPEYNSVILHVVSVYNKPVVNQKHVEIPTLILPITSRHQYSWNLLSNCSLHKTCNSIFSSIDTFTTNMWFDRLVIERFESKANTILCDFESTNSSWESTCYRTISRALGNPLNSQPFEMLTQSVSLGILTKHSHSIFQLEAILLGQAGLLHNHSTSTYAIELFKEYTFLQKKYSLTPIAASMWKFSKMRPMSFPPIRIAQLCELMYRSRSLTSHILECAHIQNIITLFDITLHDYWDTHYTLHEQSPYKKKHIGIHTIHSIIINAIIPFLFAYGSKTNQEIYKERALEFLESLPSEQNSILSHWQQLGIQSHNAYRSQALLQLHKEYCNTKRCLHCVFGHTYFSHILKKY